MFLLLHIRYKTVILKSLAAKSGVKFAGDIFVNNKGFWENNMSDMIFSSVIRKSIQNTVFLYNVNIS